MTTPLNLDELEAAGKAATRLLKTIDGVHVGMPVSPGAIVMSRDVILLCETLQPLIDRVRELERDIRVHPGAPTQKEITELLALRHLVREWRHGRVCDNELREFFDSTEDAP